MNMKVEFDIIYIYGPLIFMRLLNTPTVSKFEKFHHSPSESRSLESKSL